jgi:hypothetical protein
VLGGFRLDLTLSTSPALPQPSPTSIHSSVDSRSPCRCSSVGDLRRRHHPSASYPISPRTVTLFCVSCSDILVEGTCAVSSGCANPAVGVPRQGEAVVTRRSYPELHRLELSAAGPPATGNNDILACRRPISLAHSIHIPTSVLPRCKDQFSIRLLADCICKVNLNIRS